MRFTGDRDGVAIRAGHEVRFEKKMGLEIDWD